MLKKCLLEESWWRPSWSYELNGLELKSTISRTLGAVLDYEGLSKWHSTGFWSLVGQVKKSFREIQKPHHGHLIGKQQS